MRYRSHGAIIRPPSLMNWRERAECAIGISMVEPGNVRLHEVLYEFVSVGRYLRVNAIDPRTGIEVTMIADPRYGETLIKRLAARKLAYVISKRRPGLAGSRRPPVAGQGQSKDNLT